MEKYPTPEEDPVPEEDLVPEEDVPEEDALPEEDSAPLAEGGEHPRKGRAGSDTGETSQDEDPKDEDPRDGLQKALVRRREALVKRLSKHLSRRIRESSLNQRQIEKANGFSRGYLSQVLNGHIVLAARHVFGILLTLDEPIGPWVGEVTQYPTPSPEIDEIRERMTEYDAALKELRRRGVLEEAADGEGSGDRE